MQKPQRAVFIINLKSELRPTKRLTFVGKMMDSMRRINLRCSEERYACGSGG